MTKMKPAERQAWILQYLSRYDNMRVDVCNSDFVIDYAEATGAHCSVQFYGAPICRQLGRDLSALFVRGALKRHACGLEGMAGMGFPKWVWSYRLPGSR